MRVARRSVKFRTRCIWPGSVGRFSAPPMHTRSRSAGAPVRGDHPEHGAGPLTKRQAGWQKSVRCVDGAEIGIFALNAYCVESGDFPSWRVGLSISCIAVITIPPWAGLARLGRVFRVEDASKGVGGARYLRHAPYMYGK